MAIRAAGGGGMEQFLAGNGVGGHAAVGIAEGARRHTLERSDIRRHRVEFGTDARFRRAQRLAPCESVEIRIAHKALALKRVANREILGACRSDGK